LTGNLEKPLMSLYGTKWREHGYGLRIPYHFDKIGFHPSNWSKLLSEFKFRTMRSLLWNMKTSVCQKRFGSLHVDLFFRERYDLQTVFKTIMETLSEFGL
jgi:hypothetical protein